LGCDENAGQKCPRAWRENMDRWTLEYKKGLKNLKENNKSKIIKNNDLKRN